MQRLNPQLAHAGKQRTADAADKVTLGRCKDMHDWIVEEIERFATKLDLDFKEVWSAVTCPSKPATLTISLGEGATATNSVTFAQFTRQPKGEPPSAAG